MSITADNFEQPLFNSGVTIGDNISVSQGGTGEEIKLGVDAQEGDIPREQILQFNLDETVNDLAIVLVTERKCRAAAAGVLPGFEGRVMNNRPFPTIFSNNGGTSTKSTDVMIQIENCGEARLKFNIIGKIEISRYAEQQDGQGVTRIMVQSRAGQVRQILQRNVEGNSSEEVAKAEKDLVEQILEEYDERYLYN